MKIFNFKKIITGISLFTMTFSFGSNVNAMGVEPKSIFPADYYYQYLGSNVQLEIYKLHQQFSSVTLFHRNHSKEEFREVLRCVENFLDKYNNISYIKQIIVRTIGIAPVKNGYILNNTLFRNFLGRSKSSINENFNKLGFESFKIKDDGQRKLLEQTIGEVNELEQRKWNLRLFENQSSQNGFPIPDIVLSIPNAQEGITESDNLNLRLSENQPSQNGFPIPDIVLSIPITQENITKSDNLNLRSSEDQSPQMEPFSPTSPMISDNGDDYYFSQTTFNQDDSFEQS